MVVDEWLSLYNNVSEQEDKMNTPHSQMSHSCEGKNYLILYLCSWDKVQHNPLTQQGQ